MRIDIRKCMHTYIHTCMRACIAYCGYMNASVHPFVHPSINQSIYQYIHIGLHPYIFESSPIDCNGCRQEGAADHDLGERRSTIEMVTDQPGHAIPAPSPENAFL